MSNPTSAPFTLASSSETAEWACELIAAELLALHQEKMWMHIEPSRVNPATLELSASIRSDLIQDRLREHRSVIWFTLLTDRQLQTDRLTSRQDRMARELMEARAELRSTQAQLSFVLKALPVEQADIERSSIEAISDDDQERARAQTEQIVRDIFGPQAFVRIVPVTDPDTGAGEIVLEARYGLAGSQMDSATLAQQHELVLERYLAELPSEIRRHLILARFVTG
jgi:hypothetical protein